MKTEDYQLDEVIQIINNHNNQNVLSSTVHKLQIQNKKMLPPIENKLKLGGNGLSSVSYPKYLIFKPWSGTTNYLQDQYTSQEPIKEQIQNYEQDSQYQGERQDFMEESKVLNSATVNEIGYFYRFHTGKVRLIKCLLDENGFKDCHFNSKNWTLYWSSAPFKMDIYRSLLPYQKVNHFPNSFHLTRKDLMNKTVSKMQAKFGVTHYGFLPKTYILPQQLDQLLSQFNKHPETYIVKPHNRSQGKGITVTNSLETIYSKLQKYSSLIVSHYISNPLLINKLKFDLRIYVAITGINPLRIYVYDQGLARFATEEYDSNAYDSENKRYQHLTNYSVNKKNSEFVSSNNENEDYYGSKWSLTAMKDFLAFNVGKTETIDLFDRIDDLIVKTILSAQNMLYTSFQNNVAYINGCFEVHGFDILIDSNLKPWLIQINHSPSMNTDSSLDLKIKGNMIADLLTMVGVTPLSERYLDGGHSKFESRHYFNIDQKKSNQVAIDKFILKEIELENDRRGGWKRIFPTLRNLRYKIYFEIDRHYNRLLRENLCKIDKIDQNQIVNEDSKKSNENQYRSNTVGKNHYISQNSKSKLTFVRMNKGKRGTTRASTQKVDLTMGN